MYVRYSIFLHILVSNERYFDWRIYFGKHIPWKVLISPHHARRIWNKIVKNIHIHVAITVWQDKIQNMQSIHCVTVHFLAFPFSPIYSYSYCYGTAVQHFIVLTCKQVNLLHVTVQCSLIIVTMFSLRVTCYKLFFMFMLRLN